MDVDVREIGQLLTGGAGDAQLIETHISWVFLTETHAYKLKKPVRFEFLDFSTPEARRAACEAEVRLNRRLAGDVYQGIVAVTRRAEGALELDGTGETVDWLVKMRRLPLERTLEALIRQGTATPGDGERVARRLADFYRELAPVRVTAGEYRARLRAHIEANFAELSHGEHGLDGQQVRRVHAAQLGLLAARPDVFDDRIKQGRIVEGHGDLKPEHICLTTPLAIFDCLEFSAELRTLDVADELSFLMMECERLGAASLGRGIFDEYCQIAKDAPPAALMAFYMSYRACVRAKVAALRAAQQSGARRAADRHEAERDLELADRHAQTLPRLPLLLIRGLAGSGKSTLARALSEQVLGEVIQSDVVRRELFGRSEGDAQPDEGRYRPEARDKVYHELVARGEALLKDKVPVILDATFLQGAWRRLAGEMAQRNGVEVTVVRCHCPDTVARERIARRRALGQDASEARPELLDRQRREEEADERPLPTVEVDTTKPLAEQLQAVWRFVGRQVTIES